MPATASGRVAGILCFLEGTLGQADLAEACVRRVPGVVDVEFSGHTHRSIMFVQVQRIPDARRAKR
jgi:hypothetical protein